MAAPADLTPTDVATRAWNGAARYRAAGTTAIRVHVDIGQESGLRAVEALLEVRAGLAGILDIQIVAAASAPLTGLTGATSRARLRHALAAGADLAGVGPGFGDENRARGRGAGHHGRRRWHRSRPAHRRGAASRPGRWHG